MLWIGQDEQLILRIIMKTVQLKKGRKTWRYSNHYKKLKEKHSELCRINAINRQLAINEDANYLRSLGDVFITEPRNAGKLMKRAKKATVNSKGKFNKKKRFGKSIKNRCPSGFQAAVEEKFKTTGGTHIEVPNDYRAVDELLTFWSQSTYYSLDNCRRIYMI